MSKEIPNTALDTFGERLFLGNTVIPTMDEAALIGIGGVVSRIIHNSENRSFIDIADENGNKLLEGVNSRCYTTPERFDERENRNYVYSLVFFNKNTYPLTFLPLTNKTDSEYQFPDGTCFIALSSHHVYNISQNCRSYIGGYDYFFAVQDQVEFHHDNPSDSDYLAVPESNKYWGGIIDKHKTFENKEQLESFIKKIIGHFNQADLSHVNNKIIFKKNKIGQAFEKDLIEKIDQETI